MRIIRRPATAGAAVLLLVTPALVACGESSQEKAKAQVCDARESISKQMATLSSLTPSAASIEQVKTSVQTIGRDLSKIREAQSDLAPARREQVESATQTFGKEVSSIVGGLASNPSLASAEAQLKSSLSKLATSYEETFAPIDCS